MGLIDNGGVGLIGFFWVFMGLGFSSLIGDGGVSLIGFLWVSKAGFDRQWWCRFD